MKKILFNFISANILLDALIYGLTFINDDHKIPKFSSVNTEFVIVFLFLIAVFIFIWIWKGLLRWATKKNRDQKVKIKIKKQKKD